MIKKIISGGQTGADFAGLRAAKDSGIPTGGWMPKGCTTLDGPRYDFLELYDMKEHPRGGYPARTEANAYNSDGTIRFAKNFQSAGERCTLKFLKWHKKPYFDIHIGNLPPIQDVYDWLKEHNIEILNVAGNSEQTAPGIDEIVYLYLMEVFKENK